MGTSQIPRNRRRQVVNHTCKAVPQVGGRYHPTRRAGEKGLSCYAIWLGRGDQHALRQLTGITNLSRLCNHVN